MLLLKCFCIFLRKIRKCYIVTFNNKKVYECRICSNNRTYLICFSLLFFCLFRNFSNTVIISQIRSWNCGMGMTFMSWAPAYIEPLSNGWASAFGMDPVFAADPVNAFSSLLVHYISIANWIKQKSITPPGSGKLCFHPHFFWNKEERGLKKKSI